VHLPKPEFRLFRQGYKQASFLADEVENPLSYGFKYSISHGPSPAISRASRYVLEDWHTHTGPTEAGCGNTCPGRRKI